MKNENEVMKRLREKRRMVSLGKNKGKKNGECRDWRRKSEKDRRYKTESLK